MNFKGFFTHCKSYWLPLTLLVVGAVLFAGTPIILAYRKAKAALPASVGNVLPNR